MPLSRAMTFCDSIIAAAILSSTELIQGFTSAAIELGVEEFLPSFRS
jgi:hypothetical protein